MKHTIIFLTAVLLCACAETPVGRVKALITEGDYEQAIRVLEQVETQRPNWEEEANNFDDYYALGLLSLHRSVEGGKSPLARAVEYFEQAAESNPGELLDLQPIATRYFQIMRLPEPFPLIEREKAVEFFLIDVQRFYHNRGRLCKALGNLECAIDEFMQFKTYFEGDGYRDRDISNVLRYDPLIEVLVLAGRQDEAHDLVDELEHGYGASGFIQMFRGIIEPNNTDE